MERNPEHFPPEAHARIAELEADNYRLTAEIATHLKVFAQVRALASQGAINLATTAGLDATTVSHLLENGTESITDYFGVAGIYSQSFRGFEAIYDVADQLLNTPSRNVTPPQAVQ